MFRCWQGLLAYGCHNFVVVLDPKTVQVIQTFHHYTSAIVKVRWAHDNNNHDLNTPYNMKLAAADQAGHVMVWDVGNGKLLQEFSEPGKPVHEMHWLKNIDAPNSLLLVLHAPGQLVLFNTETNVRLWRKAFSEPLVSFALDPFDPQSMARKYAFSIFVSLVVLLISIRNLMKCFSRLIYASFLLYTFQSHVKCWELGNTDDTCKVLLHPLLLLVALAFGRLHSVNTPKAPQSFF
ncbi:WD repeat-containing protein 11-like [Rhopilema esculentum]|uniref:WD repeat-containing protein 11-like n=1 Tax=Rhopilema esculentum TaxID=499914 RepID=UPI0031D9E47D